MSDSTKTENLQTLRTLAGRCYFSGRSQMNLARDVERAAEEIVSPYGNPETKAEELHDLPERVARLAREIEEQTARLAELRLAMSDEAPTRSPVERLGSSVLVRYKQPTDRRGAGWIATLWRDNETTFRASSSFTYDNKDNDGADTAATKCLEKFAAYCNEGEFTKDLPKVAFRLLGRASLGNGSYVYTFTR